MDNSSKVLACPLCFNHFPRTGQVENRESEVFGYGLDYRIVPRDCNRRSDVATCPDCLYTSRVKDFHNRIPGQVRDLVRSREYTAIFRSHPEMEWPARSQMALVAVMNAKGLNPRDLGIVSLKGSWVARELNCLGAEQGLLDLADTYLDDALRRGLTKGDPGMVIYLLGEVNRRRGEPRRSKNMLQFLGNNPRYRYPALLLTVLVEEEDCTPYWSHHSPDRMEQHSSTFKALFPPLRSIPPGKTDFSREELREEPQITDEDDRRRF